MKNKTKRLLSVLLLCAIIASSLACVAYASETSDIYYGVVNTDGLRLRASAGTTGTILGQLYEGDIFYIEDYVSVSDVWWVYGEVQTGDNAGTWGYVIQSGLDLYRVR